MFILQIFGSKLNLGFLAIFTPQIHILENGETKIYSRNSENHTSKYPDIIARMPKVQEIISLYFSLLSGDLQASRTSTLLYTYTVPSQVLKDSVKTCVIDTEAVAWDTEKQQILPFQVLSTRKRKVGFHGSRFMRWHCVCTWLMVLVSMVFAAVISLFLQDADVSEIKVQVCVFAFDLLYLNGKASSPLAWIQTCSTIELFAFQILICLKLPA